MNKFFLLTFIIVTLCLEFFGLLDNIQIIGIVLDIVGAYLLAQGFITKNLEDIVCEAWGNKNKNHPGCFSENLGISFYKQNIEARSGFAVLALGFICQGTGMAMTSLAIPYNLGAGSILIILLAVHIIHRMLFDNERILKKLEAKDYEIS